MHTDHARCVRAVQGRDARFDGLFVTGVVSTGIYCRPSCPARTPAPHNMRFYPSAAAAHREGFRACKRCLPDATPGSPQWNVRADVVARSVRLIEDGLVDRVGVPGLAAAVGYSPRHLERLMLAEVGAGPLGLARAQRAQTARTLIERSALPLTEVAWAAGFGSVRSFNETIRAVYGTSPSELRGRSSSRRGVGAVGSAGEEPDGAQAAGYSLVRVRLPFRPPLEPRQLLGHLVATAVPGIEEWNGTAYRRTLRLPHGHGIVAVRPPDPARAHVEADLHLSDVRDLTAAVHRVRSLLDLDADPGAVDEALASDPVLAPHVRRSPGRRVPRTVDAGELAVRAVLGQQVSTSSARTLTGRLVARLGDPVTDPVGGLSRLFPEPERWAGAPDDVLRIPGGRRRTVRSLGAALDAGLDLGPGADRDEARGRLADIPGIGPWTVETVAMRAMGDPDAFIPTDLGIRAAATGLGLPGGRDLVSRAEAWRPFRSYAVQHLWAVLPHPVNDLPDPGPTIPRGES
ncbi:helix-turn-helix domain-containing protein [Nostocoides sp. F2B08]|uniref:AlkA N-terminal domain-containing protein n=1 Tax=Nostocoides sp. F2B08 TaxID=2653936 RepID=UPI001263362E|nr:AlkA N-terminal domain-containing protein [Tetrasphaera sp. F2B08]KAB7744635.1 helix-turn-helix domain-containing protein [Tetrasphaera sp. F2B08]